MYQLSLGVSICLDMVSIETLDLDTFKSWSQQLRKSRQVLKTGQDCRDKVSIGLDALKSRFLSRSRSRSPSWRQKKVSLDRRENLDGFQKLVLTQRTFSISISIGLDVETTRLSINAFSTWKFEKYISELEETLKY